MLNVYTFTFFDAGHSWNIVKIDKDKPDRLFLKLIAFLLTFIICLNLFEIYSSVLGYSLNRWDWLNKPSLLPLLL